MSAAKATAASPYHIHITPENTGLLKVTQTKEVADTASNLLQEDLKVLPLIYLSHLQATAHLTNTVLNTPT